MGLRPLSVCEDQDGNLKEPGRLLASDLKFPNLDTRRDQVAVTLDVVGSQARFFSQASQRKQHFSIGIGGHVKVVHCLVPYRHFRTRNISAHRPRVRLAFNEDGRFRATPIESSCLFCLPNADRNFETAYERQPQAAEMLAN